MVRRKPEGCKNEQKGLEKPEEEWKQQQKVGNDEWEVSTGGIYAASQEAQVSCKTHCNERL